MVVSQNFFHVTMVYVKGNIYFLSFCVFMNELESYLTNCNLNGLQTTSNEIEIQLGIYLKLFVILYADDTVLMAESSADLQNQLNSFQDYFSIWKLKVNTDNSKVMVFSRAIAKVASNSTKKLLFV